MKTTEMLKVNWSHKKTYLFVNGLSGPPEGLDDRILSLLCPHHELQSVFPQHDTLGELLHSLLHGPLGFQCLVIVQQNTGL